LLGAGNWVKPGHSRAAGRRCAVGQQHLHRWTLVILAYLILIGLFCFYVLPSAMKL
jgi:hypothetical protein